MSTRGFGFETHSDPRLKYRNAAANAQRPLQADDPPSDDDEVAKRDQLIKDRDAAFERELSAAGRARPDSAGP